MTLTKKELLLDLSTIALEEDEKEEKEQKAQNFVNKVNDTVDTIYQNKVKFRVIIKLKQKMIMV